MCPNFPQGTIMEEQQKSSKVKHTMWAMISNTGTMGKPMQNMEMFAMIQVQTLVQDSWFDLRY